MENRSQTLHLYWILKLKRVLEREVTESPLALYCYDIYCKMMPPTVVSYCGFPLLLGMNQCHETVYLYPVVSKYHPLWLLWVKIELLFTYFLPVMSW